MSTYAVQHPFRRYIPCLIAVCTVIMVATKPALALARLALLATNSFVIAAITVYQCLSNSAVVRSR